MFNILHSMFHCKFDFRSNSKICSCGTTLVSYIVHSLDMALLSNGTSGFPSTFKLIDLSSTLLEAGTGRLAFRRIWKPRIFKQ